MILTLPLIAWHVIPIGPIRIQVWGLMVGLGFLAGLWQATRMARERKLNTSIVYDLAVWILAGSFIGARLFYVLEDIPYFLAQPMDIFKVWLGGLSITGGLLGSLVATLIYIKRKKISFWPYAESIIFGLPLGIFIGRMGCALIHDHPGKITSLPSGVDFGGQIRHEPSYYLSLKGLFIFLIFLAVKKKPIAQKEGFFTSLFMILYGAIRFFLDFTRDANIDRHIFGLTLAQYFCILLFFAGCSLFYIKIIRHNTNK